jgi:hypothetical protein
MASSAKHLCLVSGFGEQGISAQSERSTCNVVIKYKYHQKNEYKDTCLLGNFAHFCIDRASLYRFDKKEKQMTTV